MKVEDFLKDTKYYPDGGYFFSGEFQSRMVAMIRGWGEIQYLFEDQKDAEKFQDEIGYFIADAINEKLNKAKQ